MKVLVTGGAGFIGSHLCKYLSMKGHQVVCLDNFFTGRKENIADLHTNPDFELIEQDVRKPFDIKVDQIYNLACPASPVHYQKSPIDTIEINIIGAKNCLDLSKKLGGIPVLQASTSEVYGDPEVHPQPESYEGKVNALGPRACYDEGKRLTETLFFDYYRVFQVPIKIVRIFNTYGPNMAPEDGRVISNFIIQALSGKDITLFGDGKQTRSFCYVDDLVIGLHQMMETVDFIGPVNLGNPNEFTIKELAEKIINKVGSSSQIVNQPLPQDDPKQRQPEIKLAQERLGWRPTVELEEGLDKTIEYFRHVTRNM